MPYLGSEITITSSPGEEAKMRLLPDDAAAAAAYCKSPKVMHPCHLPVEDHY